jgi:hypothetical protein
MPLLDLLKTHAASTSPPQAASGLSLAEEWISLSVAIGLEMDQIPKHEPDDGTMQPPARTPEVHTEREAAQMDALWPRVLEVCPQDLLDVWVAELGQVQRDLALTLCIPAAWSERISLSATFVGLLSVVCGHPALR